MRNWLLNLDMLILTLTQRYAATWIRWIKGHSYKVPGVWFLQSWENRSSEKQVEQTPLPVTLLELFGDKKTKALLCHMPRRGPSPLAKSHTSRSQSMALMCGLRFRQTCPQFDPLPLLLMEPSRIWGRLVVSLVCHYRPANTSLLQVGQQEPLQDWYPLHGV